MPPSIHGASPGFPSTRWRFPPRIYLPPSPPPPPIKFPGFPTLPKSSTSSSFLLAVYIGDITGYPPLIHARKPSKGTHGERTQDAGGFRSKRTGGDKKHSSQGFDILGGISQRRGNGSSVRNARPARVWPRAPLPARPGFQEIIRPHRSGDSPNVTQGTSLCLPVFRCVRNAPPYTLHERITFHRPKPAHTHSTGYTPIRERGFHRYQTDTRPGS